MTNETDRPLRADAARNREAILEAAEALLGEEGPSLSTESVAARAGVGVGTVFRRFPTKEELLMAVVAARAERLTRHANELVVDDDGEALFQFFDIVVAHTASTPAILFALNSLGIDAHDLLTTARAQFMVAFGELVDRAQGRGVLRADVDVSDVFDLLVAVVHAAERRGHETDGVRRILEVVTDGLRA